MVIITVVCTPLPPGDSFNSFSICKNNVLNISKHRSPDIFDIFLTPPTLPHQILKGKLKGEYDDYKRGYGQNPLTYSLNSIFK